MSSIEAIVRWWLALSAITVAFAPLAWRMASGFGKYRHALLRPIGLVAATFVAWWPASLLDVPFRLETILIGVVVAGGISWCLLLRRGRYLLNDFRQLALFELVWLIGLLGYVARSQNPDIANTEKPMEIALLSSIAHSDQVPASGPRFAGSAINYYYFGYQTAATLIHTSGVSAAVAFNLMLGTVFASTISVAAGLGAWLADRSGLSKLWIAVSAALATFFVGLAGNLETAVRLIRTPGETASAGWWDGVGWQASRIIVDTGINGNPAASETINEFPAFSFVLGDLHPHLTTLPMLLTTIALAASLVEKRNPPGIARTALIGGFAGLLYASNSWDAPVGVLVVLGALWLGMRRLGRDLFLRCGSAIAAAIAAALPFAISYTAPVGVGSSDVPEWLSRIPVIGSLPDTIAIVTWRPSSTSELLTVHGAWIAIGTLFTTWVIVTENDHRAIIRNHASLIVPAGLILMAAAVAWAPALVLLGIPAGAALLIAIRDERMDVALIGGLFAAGYFLALVPEFLYIQDSFGNRMNTVFKLNFQAWMFLGLASAVAGIIVTRRADGLMRSLAIAVIPALVVLVSPYVFLSAEDWMDLGTVSRTLDGSAYLQVTNADEASAIEWLQQNSGKGDVIVEAPGCAYQSLNGVPMNRFSAFTGVPTLLGWENHERQWRRGEFENLTATIGARDALAGSWLNGQPDATPADLVPRYVIFGTIERSTSERCPMLTAHGDADVARLAASGWAVAFQEGQTTILARADDPAIPGN
ncbi:MAG: DUF2298 domain-containing protein [Thermomicrobiales bacterium]